MLVLHETESPEYFVTTEIRCYLLFSEQQTYKHNCSPNVERIFTIMECFVFSVRKSVIKWIAFYGIELG